MKQKFKTFSLLFCALAMTAMCACTKDNNNPNNGGGNGGGNGGNNNTYNGHAYVDLGLPSGTLWATCNVGAERPEDFGDYFAWGETTPKTTYDWSTYKFCNGPNEWGDYVLTKYCDNSAYGYNGYTDTLTILLPEDDAATANWGNGWRMPTGNDMVELYENTTYRYHSMFNGVKGVLFTSKWNDNTLFLPHAGMIKDTTFFNGGYYYFNYWLSSNTTGDIQAGVIGDYTWMMRCYGLSVRAVCSGTPNWPL